MDMAALARAMVEEYLVAKSPLSSYGMGDNITPRMSRVCGNCGRRETSDSKLKVCRRCKQLKVPKYLFLYRHYCCKECQLEHWKIHRYEHTEYELHFGTCLNLEENYKFVGEVRRLWIKLASVCNFNTGKVLRLLMHNIGKPNILTIECYCPIERIWTSHIKDGPHVEKLVYFGMRHTARGLKLTSFPRPSDTDAPPFKDGEGLVIPGTSYDVTNIDYNEFPFYENVTDESSGDDDPLTENEMSLRFICPKDIDPKIMTKAIRDQLQCQADDFIDDGEAWTVTVPETRRAYRILKHGFRFHTRRYERVTTFVRKWTVDPDTRKVLKGISESVRAIRGDDRPPKEMTLFANENIVRMNLG